MDCNLPGSSIHGTLQARILECIAISFSRGSSPSRDQNQVSRIAGRCFNLWARLYWNQNLFLCERFCWEDEKLQTGRKCLQTVCPMKDLYLIYAKEKNLKTIIQKYNKKRDKIHEHIFQWRRYCCCCWLVTQSCLTPCNPVECGLPGSSVYYGILQAWIVEWVAIFFSTGSS